MSTGEKLYERALAARARDAEGPSTAFVPDADIDAFVANVERLLEARNGELCELKALARRRFRMVGRFAYGEPREVTFVVIGRGHCEVEPSRSVYTPADLARRILGANYCRPRKGKEFSE